MFRTLTLFGAVRGRHVFRAIFRRGENNAGSQNVLRVEPDVYAPQAKETLDHQARPDEQHERQGDLRHDEQAARASAKSARSTSAFFQRVVEIDARRLQRRHRAEDRARKQSDAYSEDEHAQVDAEIHPERKLDRNRGQQQVQREERKRETDNSAHNG